MMSAPSATGRSPTSKVPRHVRSVAEFPMTVTGKARKIEMRQKMIEELGLKEAISA